MDFLKPVLDTQSINAISNLGLAHIGDCVYEIMTRSYLVCGGKTTAKSLHKATISIVKATCQADVAAAIQPILTEEEKIVFNRGRNAKPKSIAKGATIAQYAYATALETLFGWLYLNQKYERLNELFSQATQVFEA